MTKPDWNITLSTNDALITFKLDTGAQVNILPQDDFNKLPKKSKLHSCKVKLSAYNGSSIPVLGKAILYITHKGHKFPVIFIIADIQAAPILGLSTCTRLDLIQRVMKVNQSTTPDYVKNFKDCFDVIGKLPGTHHIATDPSVTPVVHPPRKLPIALKSKLKKELQSMVKMGIIKPVQTPTDWVSSLVVVEKPNGKLRVCLDPRDLNKAVKRQHYQLPTTEEILANMTDAQIFTKLDDSNAYWQICVDEESSRLLTFNTPFGRYSFQRLPFGIHSASELCQLKISQILEGLDGVLNSQDDIIIWASNREELQLRTVKVLQSIRS